MIIVTGGAGFIGSAFISSLNRRGHSNIIVVDEIGRSDRWRNLVGKSFVDFVNKETFLSQVTSQSLPYLPSAIIHMGACSSTTERDVDYLLRNNYEYTKTLAQYCLARDIRFIYASSAATYGDGSQGYQDDPVTLETLRPLNAYGYSKHLFDLWAKQSGALSKIVGLKFFNVYGPNEYYKGEMASVVFKAFNSVRDTGSFSLFKSYREDYRHGEQKRDFVYIKDCSEIMHWLLENPSIGGIFNVGSGVARSWNDLLGAIFTTLGLPSTINYIDMPDGLKNQYQYFTEAPMQKLRAAGYTPVLTSLEDGVSDYITHFLQRNDPHL
jgi:ADP-L-glycero-D-manno-heptose 6-epimerase